MEFFLNQVADVGTRITWTDKRFRRFLFEIRDLMDFKGEINNSWGMYALYIHSNGRTIKDFVERLCQYGINVDSADRNIISFPDPFQYNIIFNGDRYSNQPVIQKKFKDIKYLKLETISLPDQYSIKKEVLVINPDIANLTTYFGTHYHDIELNTIYTVPMSLPPIYYIPVSKYINWIYTITINDSTIIFKQNQSYLDSNSNLSNEDYTTIYNYINKNYSTLVSGTYTIPSIDSPVIINQIEINWIINYIINDNPDTLNGDSSIVYEIDNKGSYNKYYIDTTKKISDDRFFYVYIPEIKSQNYTTSSDNVTFIVNCTGTNDYTLLNNVYPTFMFYKDSNLELANKYTVKITDRYGKVYKVNNMDYNANIENCNCQNEIDYSCRCSYIRNPYYIKLQVSLQFKFGTFEDDLYKEYLNPHPIQG